MKKTRQGKREPRRRSTRSLLPDSSLTYVTLAGGSHLFIGTRKSKGAYLATGKEVKVRWSETRCSGRHSPGCLEREWSARQRSVAWILLPHHWLPPIFTHFIFKTSSKCDLWNKITEKEGILQDTNTSLQQADMELSGLWLLYYLWLSEFSFLWESFACRKAFGSDLRQGFSWTSPMDSLCSSRSCSNHTSCDRSQSSNHRLPQSYQ